MSISCLGLPQLTWMFHRYFMGDFHNNKYSDISWVFHGQKIHGIFIEETWCRFMEFSWQCLFSWPMNEWVFMGLQQLKNPWYIYDFISWPSHGNSVVTLHDTHTHYTTQQTHTYTHTKQGLHQAVTLTQWTFTGMPGHYSGTMSQC